MSPVHTHPGSEAFYVLAGETSQKTAYGTTRADAGQSIVGHGADTPMQVSSSGSSDLEALVMFVVDADRPFSSPAKFH
jgi:quercetin dioxygenase-like cupin family protein